MTEKKITQRNKLLLGVTGSVAAIKIPCLIEKLQEIGFEIRLVITSNAVNFISISSLTVPVYQDENEWSDWREYKNSVLHIQLRNWADVLLLAPLSANSLAKMAYGLADNLLTTITRAWWFPNEDISPNSNSYGESMKPVYFAPAMNTSMWQHPFTYEHIERLTEKLHWKCIHPIQKKLFCGEIGVGAMAEVEDIVNCLKSALL
ncbi:unnamed protein product [Heterobilharzia americana]|nr:unnamed protein product [Heterobilharzia americana]CAH8594939.1 unnamed protein product [Heterobilharzia americana]